MVPASFPRRSIALRTAPCHYLALMAGWTSWLSQQHRDLLSRMAIARTVMWILTLCAGLLLDGSNVRAESPPGDPNPRVGAVRDTTVLQLSSSEADSSPDFASVLRTALESGGVLSLGPGEATLRSTLMIDSTSGVRALLGAGQGRTVLRFDFSEDGLPGVRFEGVDSLLLEGIAFHVVENANHQLGSAIDLQECRWIRMHDLSFSGRYSEERSRRLDVSNAPAAPLALMENGISVHKSEFILIDSCRFEHGIYTGVRLRETRHALVTRCTGRDLYRFFMVDYDGSGVHDAEISRCEAEQVKHIFGKVERSGSRIAILSNRINVPDSQRAGHPPGYLITHSDTVLVSGNQFAVPESWGQRPMVFTRPGLTNLIHNETASVVSPASTPQSPDPQR